MAKQSDVSTVWISPKKTAEILQVPIHAIHRLMSLGVLQHRRLPRMRPQILRESAERVARESIDHAKV